MQLYGQPLMVQNPGSQTAPYTRLQSGCGSGGPIKRPQQSAHTFFFVSFEKQNIHARQEVCFAVPTVGQRGIFGTGDTGFSKVLPYVDCHDSRFSSRKMRFQPLSLFPNNPAGALRRKHLHNRSSCRMPAPSSAPSNLTIPSTPWDGNPFWPSVYEHHRREQRAAGHRRRDLLFHRAEPAHPESGVDSEYQAQRRHGADNPPLLTDAPVRISTRPRMARRLRRPLPIRLSS